MSMWYEKDSVFPGFPLDFGHRNCGVETEQRQFEMRHIGQGLGSAYRAGNQMQGEWRARCPSSYCMWEQWKGNKKKIKDDFRPCAPSWPLSTASKMHELLWNYVTFLSFHNSDIH